MTRRAALLASTGLLVTLAGMPDAARAQSVWGGTGSTTSTSDYNLGTNWSTAPAGAPPVAGGQDAAFGATGSTSVVVTAGPIAPVSWTFNAASQSYVVTGAAVNFSGGGGGLFNNASAGQAISIANNMTAGFLQQSGAGTLTLSGTSTFTGGADAIAGTLANSGTLTAPIFTNHSGAIVNNSGTLTSTIPGAATFTNDLGATLNTNTATSIVNAGILNRGTVNARGQVNRPTINNDSALFTVTGALTGNNSFTLNDTARLDVSGGNFTGITNLANSSTDASGISISAGRTLSANFIFNNAGATIDNRGTLTAASGIFNNAGATLNTNTATSIVNGGLTNSGTVNARNQVNGEIQNTGAGLFTVSGNLAANNSFDNGGTAQLAVSGGDLTGITSLTNSSTDASGINISAGRTLSANSITNSFGATINNSGTLTANSITNNFGATINNSSTLTANSITNNFGATINNSGTLTALTSLTNNGTITGAYAMAGGTLSGIGNTANLAVNGGTFAPGNGAAGSSMTITGSLALQASAVYMVQINPTTSSFANVTGTATLGGSTVQAVFANGSYVAKQYTILTAGSISGTFSTAGTVSGSYTSESVNGNLPANFHTTLTYDATHAYLNLILNFRIPGNINGNQAAVGDSLTNFFNSTGGIPVVFSALTAAGLSQASGESAVGSQQTTFNAMNQFMGLMTDPFTAGRADGANAPAYAEEEDSIANAYAASGKPRSKNEREAYAALYSKAPLAKTYDPRWSVWGAGFGGSQTTDGNTTLGSNNTTTSRLFGVAAGADYFFSPNTVAGFALAGGGTNFSVNGFGSGRSDLFQAGAFIRHTAGAAYLTGALAYGWQDVTTDRTVTIAGIDRLRAQFNANAFSGRAEGGYRFVAPVMGGIGITPYAAGQFTTFELPAYTEQVVSGANTFALAYAAKSVTATRSELGLRTDKSFAMQTAVLTLRGRAAWAHDFNPDRAVAATFQTLPGASFVVNGARQASDAALTTASAEIKWMNGWSATGTFEGEFSNVTRSYAGKGALRYAW